MSDCACARAWRQLDANRRSSGCMFVAYLALSIARNGRCNVALAKATKRTALDSRSQKISQRSDGGKGRPSPRKLSTKMPQPSKLQQQTQSRNISRTWLWSYPLTQARRWPPLPATRAHLGRRLFVGAHKQRERERSTLPCRRKCGTMCDGRLRADFCRALSICVFTYCYMHMLVQRSTNYTREAREVKYAKLRSR